MNTARQKIGYYAGKLLIFAVSVFVLSLMVFFISRMAPGDPLVSYYGSDRTEKMSVEERERAMDRMGLNEPIIVQYGRWLKDAVHGDFGISYKYKQDVLQVISGRVANTLILGGTGFVLTFAGALVLGVACAAREDKALDRILCRLGTFTSCIPEFWLCLVLILIFCVSLGILPSSGAYSTGRGGDVWDRMLHLILPLSALVLSHIWYYAYMFRNAVLQETREDYVLLAKAKGMSRREIMLKHCVRNILPVFFSVMAISVSHILGGTYIIETVFSYPGIGQLSYESARYHDYNMLMVLCMLTGVIVIFCNMAAQIINERIDPRVRSAVPQSGGSRGKEVTEHA